MAGLAGMGNMGGMGSFPSAASGAQSLPSNLNAAAAANMLSPFMFGGMGADAAAAATMMNWAAAAQGLGVVGSGNPGLVANSQATNNSMTPSCRVGMGNVGNAVESVAQ